MNHEQICLWLGLNTQEEWPPDHYRLLGLKAGESSIDLIEQRVHERLDTVRRYQMTHPDQATEAMNRLAQAFVCLTEPAAKKVYDTNLLGSATSTPVGTGEPLRDSPDPRDPLAWLHNPATLGEPAPPPVRRTMPPPLPGAHSGSEAHRDTSVQTSGDAPTSLTMPPPIPGTTPPPIRRSGESPPTPPPVRRQPAPETQTQLEVPETAPAPQPVPEVAASPPPEPEPEPLDPAVEAARSPRARRGLGTKRALYYRVARTRQLLRLWDHVGQYLESPTRRLTRTAEFHDLEEHLEEIVTVLEKFPPLLGEAGQPGYLVVALADQEEFKSTIHKLSASQRKALSRDWQAGLTLLTSHRDFLREELRVLRQCSFRRRMFGAVRAFFKDHRPTFVLLVLLALIALNVAVWRAYGPDWWNLLNPSSGSLPAESHER